MSRLRELILLPLVKFKILLYRLTQKQIGILITDHNVQETLSITDRAYIINEGTILEAGPPATIVNSQKARAVYLGERFKL